MSTIRSRFSREAIELLELLFIAAKLINYKISETDKVIVMDNNSDRRFILDATLIGDVIEFTVYEGKDEYEKLVVSNEQKIQLIKLMMDNL